MRKLLSAFCITTGVVILASWGAVGQEATYEVVPVPDGGTISGVISLDGIPLFPKRFKVEKTPEVCGEEDRIVTEVKVKDSMLADAVIFLEAVAAGKAYKSEEAIGGPPPGEHFDSPNDGTAEFPGTTLKPKTCIFGSYTGVVANGTMMHFRNQDPVKHSPHTYAVKGKVRKSMFNLDLEGDGELDIDIKFKSVKERVLKLECDQHDHMQNWFRRVENPYYAFSEADGSYTITDVPPGEYELVAWHPKFKRDLDQVVIVEANGTVTADFTFKSRIKPGSPQATGQVAAITAP